MMSDVTCGSTRNRIVLGIVFKQPPPPATLYRPFLTSQIFVSLFFVLELWF